MPITKTQFYTASEERVRDMMQHLHSFLRENRDMAYSEKELRSALRIGNDPESKAIFDEALRALDGLEAVRWGLVRGEDYYIYNDELRAS